MTAPELAAAEVRELARRTVVAARPVAPPAVTAADAVLEICARLAAHSPPGSVRSGAQSTASRLQEPLRVAVAGRVSTGKSTLVNALLGVPVAPTAAGECTRVVTWYRYGDHDEARALLRDGTSAPIPMGVTRSLSENLPMSWDEIEAIEVRLYCSQLKDLTLIDTPGVSSSEDAHDGRLGEMLTRRSQKAAKQADALLYVVAQQVREDDHAILSGFAEEAAGLRTSAANTVVVINKIDKMISRGDNLAEVSQRLVLRARGQLGRSVAAVLPTLGLLAQTSQCGLLDESLAAELRTLVSLSTEQRRERVRRARADDPGRVADGGMWRALRLLDLYGLDAALTAIEAGSAGARDLSQMCEELSGIRQLHTILFDTFASRAGLLKADSALDGLRTLLIDATPLERRLLTEGLAAGAEDLALRPDGRQLRVFELLHDAEAGRVELPSERYDDVCQWVGSDTTWQRLGLTESATADEIRSEAIRRAGQWRAYGNHPGRDDDQRQAAQLMTSLYAASVPVDDA